MNNTTGWIPAQRGVLQYVPIIVLTGSADGDPRRDTKQTTIATGYMQRAQLKYHEHCD